MGKIVWKKQWNHWVRKTRLPGIWSMKKGGHIARGRVTDPTNGKKLELRKVLPQSNAQEALAWLGAEKEKVRSGRQQGMPPKMRFADYALALFERKVAKGDLKSTATQGTWRDTLVHLIGGTCNSSGELVVHGFGEYFVEQITVAHIDHWMNQVGSLIETKEYSPHTVNSWLAILKVILKAARREFDLPKLVTEGVPKFDTSNHVTYSEEAPNSLTPEQVSPFLAALRDSYPQFYAMAFLGLATGLRPCSLRPLRLQGELVDIVLSKGLLRVRQSQTRGEKVMETTKQRTRYTINLPPQAIEVLRWHINTQREILEQPNSHLLFPSTVGGFRSPTVLNKPFADISKEIGLGYNFTQIGMRRTFNDLMRAAKVEAIITRSISGHLTETMQHHYSTVTGGEQRSSIAKVIDLMTAKERMREAS